MKIITVVKDPGGTNAVLPIVTQLRTGGHTVHLVANGKATELLTTRGLEHFNATDPQAVIDRFGIPRILLTSMCSGGGVGRDLVPLLRGKTRTVAVQDQWGARLLTDWADEKYRPDCIVVGDYVAKQIVRKAWPDYAEDRIADIGWAALDELRTFDKEAANLRVRQYLGVGSDSPLFYYSGQVQASSGALRELLLSLDQLALPCRVAAAKHPRMDESDMPAWEQVVGEYPNLVLPLGENKPSENEFVAASVTVSMFGTALTTAAALRRPAISLMYPDSPMRRRYREVTGGLMDEHPLVLAEAVAGPKDQTELGEVCRMALDGQLGRNQRTWQSTYVRVGENASRIAAFISRI